MSEKLDVRMVRLAPVRFVSFHGFGEGPEGIACEKALTWVKESNLLADGKEHRVFGFNNPDPSAGSPNYGYEIWVEVPADLQVSAELKVVDFAGGLYAVTRCTGGPFNLPQVWGNLVTWREHSAYQPAHHQWLEDHLNFFENPALEDMLFDIYLPVAE